MSASRAITDPELIKRLNEKAGISSHPNAVTDPDLISRLNAKSGNVSQDVPQGNTIEQYQKQAEGMQGRNYNFPPYVHEDVKKIAGYGTMLLAPEIKFASLLPSMIRSRLPQLGGAAKIAADYLGSVGKVGAGTFAGSKILGADNAEAAKAGGVGAGITAGLTPLMMAGFSSNPFVRAGLGAAAGYGGSSLLGGDTGQNAIASGLGGLLGLRGVGAKQLAAQNVAETLTPEQIAQAQARQAPSQRTGIPLSIGEATGNPVLKEAQNQVAMTKEGSKVMYPWSQARGQAEEGAYNNLLNEISPEYSAANNADLPFSTRRTMEPAAFDLANRQAQQQGTKVNVDNVVDHINMRLPGFAERSKISKALRDSRDQLALTPNTQARYEAQLAPLNQMEENVNNNLSRMQRNLEAERGKSTDPYQTNDMRDNTKIKKLEEDIRLQESALNQVQQQRENFIRTQGISNYENTVPGLHNAKMGIQGIIEGQGESAIGNTAKGEVKQVQKRLISELKSASPQYGAATQMSNLRQARQEIQDSMAQSEITGSNFNRRVLQNRNEYDKLHARLADPRNPRATTTAQRNLADMKEILPDLLDATSAKSSKALADQGHQIGIDLGGLSKSILNKLYLNRYNKAVAELLVNPQWQQEIRNIAEMKAGEDRGIRLGRLVSKVATIGSVGPYQNQQGSEQYGPGS